MEINTTREKDAVIVSLKGRMDAITSLEFDESMSTLISAGGKFFIINLSQLDYISSAGLRSFLKIAKQLKAKDGKILFAGLQGPVHDVFKISGFITIFNVYETEEEALKSYLCAS